MRGSSRRDRERAIADHRFLRRARCGIARDEARRSRPQLLARRDRHGRRLRTPRAPRDPLRPLHPEQPRALQHPGLGDELTRRRVGDRAAALVGPTLPRRGRPRHGMAPRPCDTAVGRALPVPRNGVPPAARPVAPGSRLRAGVLRDERARRRCARSRSHRKNVDDRRGGRGRSRRDVHPPDLRRRVRRDRGSARRPIECCACGRRSRSERRSS